MYRQTVSLPKFSSWIARSKKRFPNWFKSSGFSGALLGISLLTATADCVPPATGLVGWWRAENNGADVTGAHDGSFPYGIAFTTGEAGQAFDFDTSFRRLNIPDSPAFQLTNAMTLEGWVYPRAYGGFICFRGDNRPGLDTWVLDTYQPGFVNFQIDDEGNNYSSVRAPLALNQWQHVAATWERVSGDMKVYVNSVLVAQTNTTVIPIGQLDPGNEPAIGIGNHGGTFHQFPMNGLVDEFAIYNRALADSEIQSIYNASSAGKCLPIPPPDCAPSPAGLVGFWRADGNPNDSIGTNHGTLVNVAGFASGNTGQALNFSGSVGSVVIPASASLDVGAGNGFSIEAWIHPTTIDLERPIVEWNSVTGGNPYPYGVHLWISVPVGYGGGPGCLYANIVDTAGSFHWLSSAGGLITTNRFQHVALTYDKTSGLATLYLDGNQVASQNLGIFTPQTSYNLYLGNRPGGEAAAFSWDGQLDEVSLYNRTLAGTEILAIYTAGSAGKCAPKNPPPSCVTAPTGLVGWWRAEANGYDVTGTNSGSLANGAGFAPGNVGQSFIFDGADDHFDIPASPSLNVGIADGLTFETWVKPSSIAMQVVAEWNNGSGGVGSHLWLSVDHTVAGDGVGNIYVNLYDTTETSHGILSPAGVMTANEWQHIAVTYDKTSGNAVLYRNGTAVSSQNLGVFMPQTSYDLHLGYRASSAFFGTYFGGLMDEPSLYNRALAVGEIQTIYNAGTVGKCVPPTPPSCTPPSSSMVGWWKAEANANDAAGENNGDTLNGVLFTNGVVGQAFYFDGVDDRVLVPSSASLNFGAGADFSVEAWIKPQMAATDFGVQSIVNKRFSPSFIAAIGWEFGLVDGRLMCQLADAPLTDLDFSTFVTAGSDLRDGQFHHVALSIQRNNSSGGKLMVDGQVVLVFDPTSQPGDLSTTEPLRIGAHADAALNSHFTGAVDEVGVYNTALSEADVLAIYNSGSAGKCPPVPVDQFIIAGPITNSANGHAYYLTVEMSWHDAEALGVRLGGHLTTINDDDENNWVFNTFSSWGETDRELWIGMTDEAFEGEWRWRSGSSSAYRHWLESQPDNHGGSENYAHFWMPHVGAPPGTWNDAPGYLSHFAVIEVASGEPAASVIIAGPITNAANGHAYYLLSPTNWLAAEQIAVSLGGHLVTINNASENQWVYDTFSFYGGQPFTLWIGMTDQQNEGDWRWISGAPAPYSNWYWGEPNNAGENENYAWMWNPNSGAGGTWNDAPDSYIIAAVVEIGDSEPPTFTDCVEIPPGMVAWWRAEGDANDFTGTNHGSVIGGTSFALDAIGQSYVFNGADSYVNVPAGDSLKPAGHFTLEAWIKYTGTPGEYSGYCIAAKGADAENAVDWALTVSANSRLRPHVNVNGGWYYYDCNTPLNPGTWYHVALVYDGDHLQGYVNGALDGSMDVSGPVQTSDESLRIGAYAPVNGEGSKAFFAGRIDEVTLYNRDLTAPELLAIYNAGSNGKCAPIPLDQLLIAGPITNSANGHAYYLTKELTWHDAEKVGVRLGGHLTTINDEDENNWVFNTFSSWGETDRELWIGLTDQVNESEWLWISGSSSAYRHWLEGQPDNYGNQGGEGGEGGGEDYAHFWMPNVGAPPGTWNDAPGYLSHYGVIEVGIDPPLPVTNCIAPPAGLVAWWQAESNAVDIVGGSNGTLQNGATFGTGNVGQAFSFDGVNDFVSVADAPNLRFGPTSPMTVDMWVYRTSSNPVQHMIGKRISCTGSPTEGTFQLALDMNTGAGLAFGGPSDACACSGHDLPLNTWTHLAGTFDGTTLRLFINAQLAATTTGSLGPANTAPLKIGDSGGCGAFYGQAFAGLIDEVSLYNRALSTNEIQAIYNAGSAGKCANPFQPVAMPDAFSTGTNTPVSFNAQKLLLNDYDPNGLAVSFASVSSNSALGGAIEMIAGRIHYSPPSGFEGNDQFTYAITNEQGRAASGIVTATVGRGGPVGLNITFGPVVDGGQFVVRFAGIPGLNYTIEASPHLEGGWVKVASFTAPATDIGFGVGVFEFREPITGEEARYYRTVYPSY